jgi:succinate dehydrogenase (ubiquinone) cytochrome b560 subunit
MEVIFLMMYETLIIYIYFYQVIVSSPYKNLKKKLLNNYMKNNISPHVNIYKFPLTAVSSITNRLTGLYLTGLFIGSGLYSLRTNESIYKKYTDLNKNIKTSLHYSILFPINYHTLGGLRHFIWDKYPNLLENQSVRKSSLLLFGGSFAFSFLQEKILL